MGCAIVSFGLVNPRHGQPAAILRGAENAMLIIAIKIEGDHMREIRAIGSSDKLRRI